MLAFFALLQTLQGGSFTTVTRKLRHWDQVPAEEQPYLCMVEHTEHDMPVTRGLPLKRGWDLSIWVYAKAPNDSVSPGAPVLNNLLDAIEAAIAPPVYSNVLTLGGSAYRVWPEGAVKKDPGDIDGQALAIYPIMIRPP
jgi:hypothetical protein